MGWARFGTARDYDDLPIEDWMDGRNDEVAQRQAYEDAGYDAWASSTGTGTNLQAAQPSDVVALGGSSLGAAAAGANDDPALGGQVRGGQGPTSPAPRYVRARPGDSISSLLGTSSPGAIGRFAALNGMDGGSSTIYSGRVYALPTDGTTISADETAAGSQLLARDNARAAALRARNIANDQLTARLLAGKNVWTGEPTYAGPVPVRSDLGSVASLATRPSWYDNPAIKVPAGAAAFTGGLSTEAWSEARFERASSSAMPWISELGCVIREMRRTILSTSPPDSRSRILHGAQSPWGNGRLAILRAQRASSRASSTNCASPTIRQASRLRQRHPRRWTISSRSARTTESS